MNIKQYKTEMLDCLTMLGESKNQYFKNNEIIKKRSFYSSKSKKNILKILGLNESNLKKKLKQFKIKDNRGCKFTSCTTLGDKLK